MKLALLIFCLVSISFGDFSFFSLDGDYIEYDPETTIHVQNGYDEIVKKDGTRTQIESRHQAKRRPPRPNADLGQVAAYFVNITTMPVGDGVSGLKSRCM